MNERRSIAEVLSSLEAQAAFHREREAYHAAEAAVHQERQGAHKRPHRSQPALIRRHATILFRVQPGAVSGG